MYLTTTAAIRTYREAAARRVTRLVRTVPRPSWPEVTLEQAASLMDASVAPEMVAYAMTAASRPVDQEEG